MSTHHILEDLFGLYSSASAANAGKRIAGKSVSEYHHMEHHLPLVGYITRVMSVLVEDNAA